MPDNRRGGGGGDTPTDAMRVRAAESVRARIAAAPPPRWRAAPVVDFTPWSVPVLLAAAASIAVAAWLGALRVPGSDTPQPPATIAGTLGLPPIITQWKETGVPPSNDALVSMRGRP